MKRLLIFIFIGFCFAANAQQMNFPFASKSNRDSLLKMYMDTTIKQYLSLPPNDDNEGLYNHAFWAIELMVYKTPFVQHRLQEAWKVAPKLSDFFQENLIEAIYSLYPTEFKQQVNGFMLSTKSPFMFVRCAEYLLRADYKTYHTTIQNLLKTRFATSTEPALAILKTRIANWNKPVDTPPLQDIFSKDFLAGKTVIYSLQRSNRDYGGMVIIRKPDGSFVTNSDGSLFHAAQIARAITNYPYYITNGNTPQGIYRWRGFEVSKLKFIGPTPNLQLTMPFELKASAFFADSGLVNTQWNRDLYAQLLPQSWKDYAGIYQSYEAGSVGRYDIIMHGTTIDPTYYKTQTYYPQTPSLGCLCSYEEWDVNGNRVLSNQQAIDDALDSIGSTEGYVVVIDLDNAKKAVTPDDIKQYITY